MLITGITVIYRLRKAKINFDHPDSVEFTLLIEHLRNLVRAEVLKCFVYSYLTCIRSQETIL